VRTIRSEADVHPTRLIEATLLCGDPDKRDLIGDFSGAIRAMVRAEQLHILDSGIVPDDAGHALFQDIEVFVPLKGLIDAAGEIAKLAKERAKLEKELQRIEGKLRNEKFLSKAPADIVDKEKQKREELQVRLDKNAESTARIQKLL
ncbi:MAG TPA: valine--tRNA ligase, partial [Desulfobacteraceae bacterium]|nr:valine--tRNA ligase [Desulfobacteraceae bacterium]